MYVLATKYLSPRACPPRPPLGPKSSAQGDTAAPTNQPIGSPPSFRFLKPIHHQAGSHCPAPAFKQNSPVAPEEVSALFTLALSNSFYVSFSNTKKANRDVEFDVLE